MRPRDWSDVTAGRRLEIAPGLGRRPFLMDACRIEPIAIGSAYAWVTGYRLTSRGRPTSLTSTPGEPAGQRRELVCLDWIKNVSDAPDRADFPLSEAQVAALRFYGAPTEANRRAAERLHARATTDQALLGRNLIRPQRSYPFWAPTGLGLRWLDRHNARRPAS